MKVYPYYNMEDFPIRNFHPSIHPSMVEFPGFFGGESIMYIPALINKMLVNLA
jgi:hypothetical protein